MLGNRDNPRGAARALPGAGVARRLAVAGVALAATLGAAPLAWGSTARVETTTVPPTSRADPGYERSTVVYDAAPGEANAVTVEPQLGAIVLTDTGATVAPGTGCAAETANRVRCSTRGFPSVRASAGDGDDTFSPGVVSLSVDLGEGDDRVPDPGGALIADGGPGDDLLSCVSSNGSVCVLRGGAGADTLSGGKGADTLVGGAGADTATGAAGDDTVGDGGDVADDDSFDGGPGEDRLSYAGGRSGVKVDLATTTSTAVTGRPGERDQARGFEDAQGGSGADVLSGDGGDNLLDGGLGADRLVGRAGADTLYANDTPGRDRSPNRLDGGAGNDSLNGGAGRDRLAGGSGADELDGGRGGDALAGEAGRDILEGLGGRDTFRGGSGPDIVDTGDGERDRLVDCGTGRDRLDAPDSADPPGRRCERVEALDGLVLASLRVRGSTARFRVSCASGPSSRCRGRVSLVGRGRSVLGRGGYAMRRGRTDSMRVRLTPAAARALMLRGRLAVTVRGRTNEIPRRFAFRLILRR